MNSPNIEPKKAFEIKEDNYTLHRRFDRMGRLVGDDMMKKLFRSHVMVIGLGGVGSWAAESLARSGIGKLTIIDFDEICITNANRQLHALQGLVGQKKANVMAERLRKINPQAEIVPLTLFYNKDTAEQILGLNPDFVIDAIDNLTAKTHLINECVIRKINVIASMGASAKMDPTRIKISDLAKTEVDPLAHSVRKILRQEYNFPRKGNFAVPCVYSDEIPMEPIELNYDLGMGFKCVCPQGEIDPHSCMHRSVVYGNASFITGAFGLAAASWVVRQITGKTEVLHA
ncbi:MAG: tRNA threonylcarbamoyladenosine dehydratase [Bdellovibrionales bacterium RIFCSPHIGHO2_01_FULL_40_29]|nr:MAG: tRNA threonylcarbamoyladenosine dehydratase [Bdellovibrionales bacterium RIFCSPHIGHO2_01_FULL_40_29]OFZ32646.1 MAG: tRNA threonylcarbamoyladenosine dehydratase [Bdellovibrionales bacterium RIFCSPHIGHO2_02_FULL_40_15]